MAETQNLNIEKQIHCTEQFTAASLFLQEAATQKRGELKIEPGRIEPMSGIRDLAAASAVTRKVPRIYLK